MVAAVAVAAAAAAVRQGRCHRTRRKISHWWAAVGTVPMRAPQTPSRVTLLSSLAVTST
jgi:hypothetical protein